MNRLTDESTPHPIVQQARSFLETVRLLVTAPSQISLRTISGVLQRNTKFKITTINEILLMMFAIMMLPEMSVEDFEIESPSAGRHCAAFTG